MTYIVRNTGMNIFVTLLVPKFLTLKLKYTSNKICKNHKAIANTGFAKTFSSFYFICTKKMKISKN